MVTTDSSPQNRYGVSIQPIPAPCRVSHPSGTGHPVNGLTHHTPPSQGLRAASMKGRIWQRCYKLRPVGSGQRPTPVLRIGMMCPCDPILLPVDFLLHRGLGTRSASGPTATRDGVLSLRPKLICSFLGNCNGGAQQVESVAPWPVTVFTISRPERVGWLTNRSCTWLDRADTHATASRHPANAPCRRWLSHRVQSMDKPHNLTSFSMQFYWFVISVFKAA